MTMILRSARSCKAVPQEERLQRAAVALRVLFGAGRKPIGAAGQQVGQLFEIEIQRVVVFEQHHAVVRLRVFEQI